MAAGLRLLWSEREGCGSLGLRNLTSWDCKWAVTLHLTFTDLFDLEACLIVQRLMSRATQVGCTIRANVAYSWMSGCSAPSFYTHLLFHCMYKWLYTGCAFVIAILYRSKLYATTELQVVQPIYRLPQGVKSIRSLLGPSPKFSTFVLNKTISEKVIQREKCDLC
jgi:hypothetical protein